MERNSEAFRNARENYMRAPKTLQLEMLMEDVRAAVFQCLRTSEVVRAMRRKYGENSPGLGESTLRKHDLAARHEVAVEVLKQDVAEAYVEQVNARRFIYQRSIAKEDYKTALSAMDSLARLQGFMSPVISQTLVAVILGDDRVKLNGGLPGEGVPALKLLAGGKGVEAPEISDVDARAVLVDAIRQLEEEGTGDD